MGGALIALPFCMKVMFRASVMFGLREITSIAASRMVESNDRIGNMRAYSSDLRARILLLRRKLRARNKRVVIVLCVLIGTQALFTTSDFLARTFMGKLGFHVSTFFHPWFLAYFLVRQFAMFGQLYVFSQSPLGKTSALFSAASLVMSNLFGFLFLREILSPLAYFGVALAITAIFILTFR